MRGMRFISLAALAATSLITVTPALAGPGGGMPGDGLPAGGCHRDYRPVCGVDHHTYPNACVARRSGVQIAYSGRCRPQRCPDIFRPVCGVNHRTYPNACYAQRDGVVVAHPGRCEFRR